MIWKTENRASAWIGLEWGCISSDEEVLEAMLKLRSGILILDGVSGCGKTMLLHRFREKSEIPVAIHSYREVTEELVHLYRKLDGMTSEKMLALLGAHPILAVEDLDYLRGLDATQEILGMMFRKAAKESLIILTGNNLEACIPEMLRCMKQAKHLKFLYPGSPEDEMLAIGSILPDDGMDWEFLDGVLTERHKMAMRSLIRRGMLAENMITLRITPLVQYREMHRNCPKTCEAFLEVLWQWQQDHVELLRFRQIRDCFCKAAEVLWDRDGTVAFRAAELMKASGEVEKALELYEQILPRVTRPGTHKGMSLCRGHYYEGTVLGYRAMKSPEPDEEGMRKALWMFRQAMRLRRGYQESLTPTRTMILWAMVYCCAYLGEKEKARRYCRRILEIQKYLPEAHPDRVETCIQFSQLCREYGRRADCQVWLLKASELLEKTPASEEMGWMYGLVACNCWKLPNEKRLELYQKEEQYSRRRFCRNPREEYQWHWQVAQLQARMGNIPEAVRNKEEIPSDGESSGNWDEIQALFSQKKTDEEERPVTGTKTSDRHFCVLLGLT